MYIQLFTLHKQHEKAIKIKILKDKSPGISSNLFIVLLSWLAELTRSLLHEEIKKNFDRISQLDDNSLFDNRNDSILQPG